MATIDVKTAGYRLNLWRVSQRPKLTQDQVAARLKTDRAAISRLESGELKISAEKLKEYEQLLGLPPGHLRPELIGTPEERAARIAAPPSAMHVTDSGAHYGAPGDVDKAIRYRGNAEIWAACQTLAAALGTTPEAVLAAVVPLPVNKLAIKA